MALQVQGSALGTCTTLFLARRKYKVAGILRVIALSIRKLASMQGKVLTLGLDCCFAELIANSIGLRHAYATTRKSARRKRARSG